MADRRKKEGRSQTAPATRTHAAPASVGPLHIPIVSDETASGGIVQQFEFRASASPIPDAAELAAYAEVYPEAPAIIFDQFRKQAEHRRELESLAIRADVASEKRGQYLAFTVLSLGMGIGAWLIQGGHDIAGSVMVGVHLVSGAGLFIYGARQKNRDLASSEPPPQG